MKKITLSKALKVKNRLVRDIKTWEEKLKFNVVQKPNKRVVDMNEVLEKRWSLVTDLHALKLAINEANKKIQHLIFMLSEKKAMIVVLKGIDARNGVFSNYSEPIEYEAQLKSNDIDSIISGLQGDIDSIQDEIDTYNATTEIFVDLKN